MSGSRSATRIAACGPSREETYRAGRAGGARGGKAGLLPLQPLLPSEIDRHVEPHKARLQDRGRPQQRSSAGRAEVLIEGRSWIRVEQIVEIEPCCGLRASEVQH